MAVVNKRAKRKEKEITPKELVGSHILANEMSSLFGDELGNNQNEHIKELFNVDGSIQGKTDLSAKQISYIARLKYVAELTDNSALHLILDEFMKLRISKDRKGRKEYVESTVGNSPNGQREGFFNRLGGMFGR